MVLLLPLTDFPPRVTCPFYSDVGLIIKYSL